MKLLVVFSFLAIFATSSALKCFPVPVNQCARAHEKYSQCGAHPACQHTCEKPDGPLMCPKICLAGCVCEDGYVKDAEGNCVLPIECPAITPTCSREFEEYTECGSACPLTCENPTGEGVMCTMQCVAGCFCQSGYVRDSNGNCVLPTNCPAPEPLECGANEYYVECSTMCGEPTCDREKALFCGLGCQKRCHCNEGYVRDSNNVCIKKEECPVQPVCATFQHYEECGRPESCLPSCDKPTGEFICPAMCVAGCFCDEGYVKDKDGNCIKPDDCPAPSVCPANEVYSECGANSCQMFCDWYFNPSSYACRPICTPGCICEEGYIRNDEGTCVYPNQCPVIPECPENQERTGCETDCDGATMCYSILRGGVIPCSCKDGYVRNNEGNCVLPDQCFIAPECTGENEERNGCERFCDGTERCVKLAPGSVAPCSCKEGYARDSEGTCVLIENCSGVEPPDCTGENEIRTGCQTDCRGMMMCASIVPGGFPPCFCKDGYVRSDEGNCILPEECPSVTPICSAAEHKNYTQCDAMCKKTCDNPQPMICPAICAEGCICEDGYLEDSNGNCVLPEECPQQTCSSNEHYEQCNSLCQQPTCENPEKNFCRRMCLPGCFCDDGYIRDSNGVCIKEEECKVVAACPANEEYSECGANGCQNTCADPTLSTRCRAMCVAGCVCKEGYLRDSEGNCVLAEECQKPDPAICFLPLETGPCRAAFKRWGYSADSGCCVEFTYGGCGGNGNNYETEAECNLACGLLSVAKPE